MIHFRYGPARQSLVEAWRAAPVKNEVANIVLNCFDRLSGLPLTSEWHVWTSNCGRNVSQHMGPHNVAKRLRLLDPVPANATCKGGVYLLASGRPYKKRKLDAMALQAVAHHAELGKAMAKMKAPRTLKDWHDQYHYLAEACSHVPGISHEAKYHAPWFIRTWLKMLMERDGVSELSIGSATPQDFDKLWPDAGGHARRLLGGYDTVYQAFAHLQYDGPPELFTMYCCLFGAPEVVRVVTAKANTWLSDQRPTLRKLRSEYERLHGQPPCPSVLLLQCAKHIE